MLVSALCLSLAAATSASAVVVTSPDDICAPTDDPCVISTSIDVDAANALDFGLRTVQIVPGGRLIGTVDLSCGAFEVNLSPKTRWMDVATEAGVASAIVTARRACSGDSTMPCLTDVVCTSLGLGSCSLGDGGIRMTGLLRGVRAAIELRGAGDIAIDGDIVAEGNPTSADGGSVTIESTQGSVELARPVNVSGFIGGGYAIPGDAGAILLRAAGDITMRDRIVGTAGRAVVEFDAGGNVAVGSAILVQGIKGSSNGGGTVDIHAQGNLDIVDIPGGGSTLINTSGGRYSQQYGYATYAGAGGYARLRAGGDIFIDRKAKLRGNSGTGQDGAGGTWYVEAGGDLYTNTKIQGRGRGSSGFGGIIRLRADGDVELGSKTLVTNRALSGGTIDIYSRYGGRVTVDGKIDGRAGSRAYFVNSTFYGFMGDGGDIYIGGGDVTVGGRVRTGGGASGGKIRLDTCRLSLPRGAVINSGSGRQSTSFGSNSFTIRESMVAAAGSRILTKSGSSTDISFRDVAKPPVLDGTTKPTVNLTVTPALTGCPVCGNFEIDQGETCDDGNTTPGDGCDQFCQLE